MARKEVVTSHEGVIELVILIKAAPEIGQKHGETVCVAGIDAYGRWHRLYPVPFRDLNFDQRFSRWDLVRVSWRRPPNDDRIESKRIDPASLQIIGEVRSRDRSDWVSRSLVKSLEDEMDAGRSLALILPEEPRFHIRRLDDRELEKSTRRRMQLVDQSDMFAASLISREAPPYRFFYTFRHSGRERKHSCIDWETEQTFFKWRDLYGESDALKKMRVRWGEESKRLGDPLRGAA